MQIIKKLIERKQAQIRKVYPGLTCFKEGVRQIPIESVPGIRELSVLSGGVGRAHPDLLVRSIVPCVWGQSPLVMLSLSFQEKRVGNHWGRKRGE